jgi:hypothetical protein
MDSYDHGDQETIDVGGLLSIDVGSELRKLSQAQFQGPWQIPAELVRRAIRGGAREVRITTQRHGVRIVDDGRGYPAEHVRWAATLLDLRRSNEERHAALTALESAGELVLLALAGLDVQHLRIETVADGSRTVLEIVAGRAPRFEPQHGVAGRWTDLQLRSSSLDRRQVSSWLRNAARFVPVDVTLDGEPVRSGFGAIITQGSLRPPLRGRLAVVKDGDVAHVWLLEHGLITGHVTVPEAPNLEAAVELGSDISDLSPARVRAAIQPYIPALVEQGVLLLAALGERGPLAESLRARVARLVLQAARKEVQVGQVKRIPVFRIVDSSGQRCVSIAELEEAAQSSASGGKVLLALYPTQRPERFAIGESPIVIADAAERSRLAELLGIRFRPPDPRDTTGSMGAALRRGVGAVGRSARRFGQWLRHPVRAPAVADDVLTPPELAFLRALRKHFEHDPRLEVQGARMCVGSGPIRRSGAARAELLLPRRNPAVVASVKAVNHDVAWVYPVALTLLDGQGLPPVTSRVMWLRHLAGR